MCQYPCQHTNSPCVILINQVLAQPAKISLEKLSVSLSCKCWQQFCIFSVSITEMQEPWLERASGGLQPNLLLEVGPSPACDGLSHGFVWLRLENAWMWLRCCPGSAFVCFSLSCTYCTTLQCGLRFGLPHPAGFKTFQ